MPAWLLTALRLLAGMSAKPGGPAPSLARRIGGPLALGTGGGLLGDLIGGDGDDRPRRRRRRRTLSQGDRDDISFIAATINQTAAGRFAVALATRAR